MPLKPPLILHIICPYCELENKVHTAHINNTDIITCDKDGCDKSFAIHVDLVPTINTSLIHYEEHEQQHRP